MQPAGHHGLSEDIWSIILTLTDPSDARTLSLVSRNSHPAARRVVLSRADITEQGQLEHALAFMVEEPHHRACWLRELHINEHALDEFENSWDTIAEGSSLAARFADLLGAAQNITSIALPYVESMLEAEPRAGTALASLTRLQVVKLSDVFTQSLDMANTMASSPTDVALALYVPCDSEYSASEFSVVLSQLALFRKTSVVEIQFCELSGGGYEYPSESGVELRRLGQHPTVRELCLRGSGALPWFHIFPNMEMLRMRWMDDSHAEFDWQEWAWTDSVPLVDVTADDESQLVCLAGAHGRPKLRQLHLRLAPSLSPDPYREIPTFKADSLRPVCLTFPLAEWQAPWNTDLPHWNGRLEDPAGPEGRLRYLQVAAMCNSDEDIPVRWVESLLPALRVPQLVCLRVNFHVATPSGKVTRLDEARQMLVEHLPSLRYLCIAEGQFPQEDLVSAFRPRFVGECAWWRVHEVAGERRSESISCAAGERVEQYLRSAEFEETLSLDGFVLNDR
ncbi:hypothetical protein EVJ58_g9368 [Rhodofomes roseus]|uniref:F-box domain-containing protein n=1 Tax=Rhodofomes roseus TaxID=34475 RepID=A0A4Y9XYE3_9APHY|nr:hypothetical protein EVJ58_g9368 [Rhodofomes roseus]